MKLRLLFLAAGVIVLVLVVRRWPAPRSPAETANLHETGFARHLLAQGAWQVHEAATGHVHFRANSHAARNAQLISQALDSARARVLALLELRDAQPIEVFLVDSRAEMQGLVGRPIAGMVQSGERTALLVYSQTYAPPLTHELTHLYSHHHWGAPRAGRWISEGLATLAMGTCQGHEQSALVKGLHDAGSLRPWPELIERFDSIDEVAGNLQAASMVEYMMRERGLRSVRAVWMKEDWRPPPPLEQAWLASVRRAPTAAHLDVPRLTAEGCVSSGP